MGDKHNGDFGDDRARFLIERGDMGHRPGEDFPNVGGNSLRALIWQAVMGRNEKEHYKSLRYAAAARNEGPERFTGKVIRKANHERVREQNRRLHEITDITFDDPYVLPRDIKAEEFVNLYSGVAFANAQGLVFNVHLTISWELLGYGKRHGLNPESPLYDLFILFYNAWCRSKGVPCVWIYSNEFCDSVGYHSHFMTSVRPDLVDKFRKYIAKRMQRINQCGEFNIAACNVSVNENGSIRQQWIIFQYLCKGIDQNATLMPANGQNPIRVSDLNRFAYINPGNLCHKKRCGLSDSISKPARSVRGFLSRMECGMLDVRHLYSDESQARLFKVDTFQEMPNWAQYLA